MRILLLPLGSLGDVNPFIGLGLALQQRGHEAVVIANDYFAPMVKRSGLAFASCGSAQAYLDAIHDPVSWHPKRSRTLLLERLSTIVSETFSAIKELHEPGKTIMAAPLLVLAARIAQESLGIPLATLALSPMSLRTVHVSPSQTFAARLTERNSGIPAAAALINVELCLRRWRRRALFLGQDLIRDKIVGRHFNSFRAKLGLEPVRRCMNRWWYSPQRVIGLWPEWFCDFQPDWPPQAVVTSFIEYDGSPNEASLGSLDSVVGSDTTGRAPIVFTAGTACFDTLDFFAAASEACEILNWPGILLAQQEEPLRKPLPSIVRHIRYAPLGELLPHTAAIVHHGGIGTAARALKAGIPQLIMPFAYDQPQNAHRLVQLGVAKSVDRKNFTAEKLAADLRALFRSQPILERCRHYAKKFESTAALENTCDYIEALEGTRP
jgi:rhamnosyltransferase subunit B